ncbi:Conserved_hypothetical protein [Hexamita inflata]|uniref:Uncharacterized protein n=1 Tax=Hexamita inflata TaxID=28002 RepID=A0AA86PSC2_9EUKA|nr:Conserved hypothetical protein [Hexamita inflata]
MDESYHSDYSNVEQLLAAQSSMMTDTSISTYRSNAQTSVYTDDKPKNNYSYQPNPIAYSGKQYKYDNGAKQQNMDINNQINNQIQYQQQQQISYNQQSQQQVNIPTTQQQNRNFQNPYSPQYLQLSEVERLRNLMNKLRQSFQNGQIPEELYRIQYKEVKTLYIEALEDVVR